MNNSSQLLSILATFGIMLLNVPSLEAAQPHFLPPPIVALNQTCGDLNTGNKGVVVDPYEQVGATLHPIIRPGDVQVVEGLKAANVQWVRMLFMRLDGAGEVNLDHYDYMIDLLCENGINVLGVINQETLDRQDFNDPATTTDYRQEFAVQAGLLAEHFEGRIKHWEVWNEEDLNPGKAPFIDPGLYADLLIDTHQAIKAATPITQAQVVYGGLSSAWTRSHNYFLDVYDVLDALEADGANRPFDYLAIHPYPDTNLPPPDNDLNPSIYLQGNSPEHDTLLDQFLETTHSKGDGNKRIWITEIGWNSGADLGCWEPMRVTRLEQAIFLKQSFDILFEETLWGQPDQAVEKMIWYQYRDIGVLESDICDTSGFGSAQTVQTRRVPLGYIPQVGFSTLENAIDWHFGLYNGDSTKTTGKVVRCMFAAYPDEGQCIFYLPLIFKNP